VRDIRILIAEDHEYMRGQLIRLLDIEFRVVDAVADGRSLVSAAIALKPDVIVSDVCMPVLSGPQAMEELSARGREIPFVFISSDPDSIRRCPGFFVYKIDLYSQLVPAVHAASRIHKPSGNNGR